MLDLSVQLVGITMLRNNIKMQQMPLKKQPRQTFITQIHGLL